MRGFRIQQCRNHLNPSSLKTIQRTLGLLSTSLPPLVLEGSQRVSESTWRTCHASSCNNRSKLLNQNQDQTVLILTQIHRHLLLVLMKATERRGSEEEEDLEGEAVLVNSTWIYMRPQWANHLGFGFLPSYVACRFSELVIWFLFWISKEMLTNNSSVILASVPV